jgi:hypothetical protein
VAATSAAIHPVTAGPGTGRSPDTAGGVFQSTTSGADGGHHLTVKAADEVRERLLIAAGGRYSWALSTGFSRLAAPCRAPSRWSARQPRQLFALFPGWHGGAKPLAGIRRSERHPAGGGRRHQRYLDELRRLEAIDLDAVIPEFVRRLEADAALKQQVCSTLTHLFVDEFQDLNASQFELVRIMAQAGRVFAIGDPDQAIYGFRGSDPEFFFALLGCRKTSISDPQLSLPLCSHRGSHGAHQS